MGKACEAVLVRSLNLGCLRVISRSARSLAFRLRRLWPHFGVARTQLLGAE